MDGERFHCTIEQLQARIDGRLGEREERDLEAHLRECARCREAVEGWFRLDQAMRRLPLVRAGNAFAYSVMARIRAEERPSALDRSLSFLPYFLGLAIVLGIMGGIFWWAGVFEGMEMSEGEGRFLEYVAPLLNGFSEGAQALGDWFVAYLPFVISDSVLQISLPAGFILAIVAILDRMIGRRVLSRTR
ncbi:MAG: zf-HC2 domain-containing protein [Bacteroidota bacterium]